jgi:Sulfatase
VKVRWFLAGAGCAILLLSDYLWPLLSLYHLAIYHDPLSVSAVAEGLALDLVAGCLLFGGLLLILNRNRPEHPMWAVFLAMVTAKAIDFTVFLLRYYGAGISWKFSTRVAVLSSGLIAALMASQFFPKLLRKGVRVAQVGCLILGCCILWMLPELIVMAISTHATETNEFSRSVQSSALPQTRIVWVLLDELSYDQVFDHRQPSVQLPTFDSLRKESVVFSDVQPVGYYTDQVVPSLFLGYKIDNIRSSLQRDLFVHDAAASRWERFDENATVFADAKRLGWTTGVAGWFNPYCHILRNVLDFCYWQAIFPFPSEFNAAERSILAAAAFPFDSVLSRLKAKTLLTGAVVGAHEDEYEDVSDEADALLGDDGIRFVYLHYPVPHPYGIYDRRTRKLGVRGTYLDNLVLADETIADVLARIQKTSDRDQTILIVSSDHSWRIKMWDHEASWTTEEERASSGRFDPRPFLLIRFPGSEKGETRSESVPELDLHGILEAMLSGKIKSQGDLDRSLYEQEQTVQNLSGSLKCPSRLYFAAVREDGPARAAAQRPDSDSESFQKFRLAREKVPSSIRTQNRRQTLKAANLATECHRSFGSNHPAPNFVPRKERCDSRFAG